MIGEYKDKPRYATPPPPCASRSAQPYLWHLVSPFAWCSCALTPGAFRRTFDMSQWFRSGDWNFSARAAGLLALHATSSISLTILNKLIATAFPHVRPMTHKPRAPHPRTGFHTYFYSKCCHGVADGHRRRRRLARAETLSIKPRVQGAHHCSPALISRADGSDDGPLRPVAVVLYGGPPDGLSSNCSDRSQPHPFPQARASEMLSPR